VSLELLDDALCLCCITLEKHVGNASLALLKDDVLKLLDVPTNIGKDHEAMCENADFVKMTNLNLVLRGVAGMRSVDPVELVTDTVVVELLDDANGLLTNRSLSLRCAGTTVMRAVYTRMSSKCVLPVVLLLNSRLACEHVCAHPEFGASLKLGQQRWLIDDITTGGVDEHSIIFHLSKELLVDHADSLGRLWRVDANNIRLGQELVHINVGETKLLVKTFMASARVHEHGHLES